MKKVFFLMSLLALPFAFVSCGSDDDDNSYKGIELSEPEFAELAEKYYEIVVDKDVSDQVEKIVLQLGEDGVALFKSVGELFPEVSEDVQSVRALKSDADAPQYAYVTTYKRSADNEDIIEFGFGGTFTLSEGKLVLDAGPLAATELVMTAVASKVNIVDAMKKVCRTWNIIQTNIKVEGGDLGSDAYSKNFTKDETGTNVANDLVYIAADIDGSSKLQNVKMGPKLSENNRLAKITSISLSKVGFIVIQYANGQKDVGEIESIGLDGKVQINWPEEFMANEYLKGDLGVKATIESNCLRLEFNSNVKGEINEPYKVRLEFVMEWAK